MVSARRAELAPRRLQEASEVAIEDAAIIPLHFQVNVWGLRRGMSYAARADEYTFAHLVRPAG